MMTTEVCDFCGVVHPDRSHPLVLGDVEVIDAEGQWTGDFQLTPMFNGNGFEAAEPDEAESSTVFRLIRESSVVQSMSSDDRHTFWWDLLHLITDELRELRSHD